MTQKQGVLGKTMKAGKVLKQLWKVQADLNKVKKNMSKKTFEFGEPEKVVVEVSGLHEVVAIKIADDFHQQGPDAVGEEITRVQAQAYKEIEKIFEDERKKVTKGTALEESDLV